MYNSSKEIVKRYFEPELRMPQLDQEIQRIQQGGGGGVGNAANVAGTSFKITMSGVSLLTSMIGAAAGVSSKGLSNAFDFTGDMISKGIKSGGRAIDNNAISAKIQERNNLYQSIQNGTVRRGISEEELDCAVMELVPVDLYEIALNKLNLDESQISEVEPIYFEDYYIDKHDENQVKALGRDGVIRTPHYQATWLFGTSNKLCIYQCIIDLLQGSYTGMDDAYFWKNITKLSNSTQTVNGISHSYFVIKGANFEYEFVYKDNPEINHTVRGLKSYYNKKNE